MSDLRRAVIDPALCVGSASCEMEEPGSFQLDDDGKGHVTGAPGALDTDRLIQVADSCPARAISVVDAEGHVLWRP